MQGFLDFIREQGVVGLAIGFILGAEVTALVKALVTNIINPIIGLFGSADSLADASFMIGDATIGYGAFVAQLINFLIIAAVVYYVFKGLGLDKLDKKKDE